MVKPQDPDVALSGGGVSAPYTFTSAIDVHGPRSPASERAVIRTYWALAGVKIVVLRLASSRYVPTATGEPKFTPSVLSYREWVEAGIFQYNIPKSNGVLSDMSVTVSILTWLYSNISDQERLLQVNGNRMWQRSIVGAKFCMPKGVGIAINCIGAFIARLKAIAHDAPSTTVNCRRSYLGNGGLCRNIA